METGHDLINYSFAYYFCYIGLSEKILIFKYAQDMIHIPDKPGYSSLIPNKIALKYKEMAGAGVSGAERGTNHDN